MTQPDRPIQTTIVGPAWANGGTEQFAKTLAKFLDPRRVRLQTIFCTNADLYDADTAATAPAPVLVPDVYKLNEALGPYDAVLFWGIDTDTWIPPSPTQARIWIAHGASHWTQSTMDGSATTTDHTVCVSKHVANKLSVRREHTIIVNGIDTARLTQTQTAARNRDEWGIPQHAPVIGYVGRLAHEKGPRKVIEALASLTTDAHALICGRGPMETELHDLANAIAPDRVHWIEINDYMGDVYSAIDVLALPSEHEGFGLAAAEAMYCGTPVIMTHTGLAADYIEHRREGIITLPSARSLASATRELLRDDALRIKIQLNAHELAMTEFMGRRMAAEYMDLIENVVGSKLNALA